MDHSSGIMSYDEVVEMEEILAIQEREEKLRQLIQETGHKVTQENGQRKFAGPPANWNGPAPPKGCEVFVGKIPRDIGEDELYNLFSQIGPIYELRLMMDFSGCNRGFGFVQFVKAEYATKAIEQLNHYQLRPGRHLGVLRSIDNCRLFIGGIPKDKTQGEIKLEMERLTEGVTQVIVYRYVFPFGCIVGFSPNCYFYLLLSYFLNCWKF